LRLELVGVDVDGCAEEGAAEVLGAHAISDDGRLRILAEESDARPVVRHAHTLVIDAGRISMISRAVVGASTRSKAWSTAFCTVG